MLGRVLPSHPNVARDTRSAFATRLEYFRELRNRIMHPEAVFQGVAALNKPVLSIIALHEQLLETIGWISLDASRLASCLDRFGTIQDPQTRPSLERTIRTAFSAP